MSSTTWPCSRSPVVLCLDRAGLVGEDGPTHHGAFDPAALRPVPNLTIASPYDERELRRPDVHGTTSGKGCLRHPLSPWKRASQRLKCPLEEIPVGKGRCLKCGTDVALISFGPIGNVGADAIVEAEAKSGLSIAHYDLRFLKPLDADLLREVGEILKIVTIEDGVRAGGMGSAVLEWMSDNGFSPRLTRLGLPDEFVEHGTVAQLRQIVGPRQGEHRQCPREMKEKSLSWWSNLRIAHHFHTHLSIMKIIIAGAGAVGTHLAKTLFA